MKRMIAFVIFDAIKVLYNYYEIFRNEIIVSHDIKRICLYEIKL